MKTSSTLVEEVNRAPFSIHLKAMRGNVDLRDLICLVYRKRMATVYPNKKRRFYIDLEDESIEINRGIPHRAGTELFKHTDKMISAVVFVKVVINKRTL